MQVLLRAPDGTIQRIQVAGSTAVVGRAPGCDVVIDEPFVSKQHARLLSGTVVVDLNSSNGTFIDGHAVREPAVLSNSWATIGKSQYALRIDEDGHAPDELELNLDATLPIQDEPASEAKPASASTPPTNARLKGEFGRLSSQLLGRASAGESPPNPPVPATRPPGDGALGELSQENARLRARVEELQRAVAEATAAVATPEPPPTDAGAASMLVFRLQRENAELRKEVAGLRSGSGTAPAAPTVPTPRAAPPPQPRMPQAASASTGATLASLAALVAQDVEGVAPKRDAELSEFLLVEGYRFLRRVERVVTRMAGGLIQLYQLNTMVPGMEGNLREILADTLENPQDLDARDRLLDYLHELGRWLVVSLGAYRQAADRFATQLKRDLSEEGLTAEKPIPALSRMTGKRDAELWQRAVKFLHELSPDLINERVERMAREVADSLLEGEAREAFS